jgi:hypothetical protein
MKEFLFLPLLSIFICCYSSGATPPNTETDTTKKKYAKVLVLCIAPVNDTEAAVKMENYISQKLCEIGYTAAAANKNFLPDELGNTDSIYTSKTISSKGFDAVLTVVLIDKVKHIYQPPGKDIAAEKYHNYPGFEKYYNTVVERIYTPGYYGGHTRYVWENNFYDISSGHLIYAYRSRSFSSTSKLILTEPIGQAMVKMLVEENILLKAESKNE